MRKNATELVHTTTILSVLATARTILMIVSLTMRTVSREDAGQSDTKDCAIVSV